ncbi:MAG: hypothetical protein JXB47_01115 [Anaerolineae bacterium]|nr:hypothetical protein [Anaerolineae bacterium]
MDDNYPHLRRRNPVLALLRGLLITVIVLLALAIALGGLLVELEALGVRIDLSSVERAVIGLIETLKQATNPQPAPTPSWEDGGVSWADAMLWTAEGLVPPREVQRDITAMWRAYGLATTYDRIIAYNCAADGLACDITVTRQYPPDADSRWGRVIYDVQAGRWRLDELES